MSFKIVCLAACIMIPRLVLSANQSKMNTQCPPVISTSVSGVPGVPAVPGLNGRDGAKGDQGPAGAPRKMGLRGAKGPKGEQGCPSCQSQQKNWKQCAWKNINDEKDSGLIKDCVFNKLSDKTALKVEYNGDFRIAYCLSCCKRWYFTFNGVECRHPLAIDGLMNIASNHGRTDSNTHKVTQIGGYCERIPKGTVRVGINVGNCVGKKGGDVTRIMIEEVPPPQ